MSWLFVPREITVFAFSVNGASFLTFTCCGRGMMLKSAVCPAAVEGRRKAIAAKAPVSSFLFIVCFF